MNYFALEEWLVSRNTRSFRSLKILEAKENYLQVILGFNETKKGYFNLSMPTQLEVRVIEELQTKLKSEGVKSGLKTNAHKT